MFLTYILALLALIVLFLLLGPLGLLIGLAIFFGAVVYGTMKTPPKPPTPQRIVAYRISVKPEARTTFAAEFPVMEGQAVPVYDEKEDAYVFMLAPASELTEKQRFYLDISTGVEDYAALIAKSKERK